MPKRKKRQLDGSTKVASPPQKLTLFDVLDYDLQYPVFERICSFLPIGDLINLTRTCKRLSSLYKGLLLPTQWNINRRLHRFVQDSKGLRSQMGNHDALISGSFAVQFFERVTWKETDLDIFIEQGSGALAFEKYLCEQEGYRFARETSHGQYWADNNCSKVCAGSMFFRLLTVANDDSNIGQNIHEAKGRLHRRPGSDCVDAASTNLRDLERLLHYAPGQCHFLEQGLRSLPSTEFSVPQDLPSQAYE